MLKCPYREKRLPHFVIFPECLGTDCPWYAERENNKAEDKEPICERTHYDFIVAENRRKELEKGY